MYKLLVDARERHVTRHPDLSEISPVIRTITVGDYIIKRDDDVIAVIERKSFEDYAASFKDGRSANKQKLLELRAVTGCRIIYIIEGEAFPRPTKYFGGIAYSNIESSIFHLMIRDNIMVLRTKDTLDTAQTLVRLMRSLENLPGVSHGIVCSDTPATIGDMHGGNADTVSSASNASNASSASTASNTNAAAIEEMITAPQTTSDRDIVRKMWASFRGITMESADMFIARFTIHDIVTGVPATALNAIKYPNGRAIGRNIIASLSGVDLPMQTRILACVPRLSVERARLLLAYFNQARPLAAVAASTPAQLSPLLLGSRPLGDALAEKIIRLLNFSDKPGRSLAPAVATPSQAEKIIAPAAPTNIIVKTESKTATAAPPVPKLSDTEADEILKSLGII